VKQGGRKLGQYLSRKDHAARQGLPHQIPRHTLLDLVGWIVRIDEDIRVEESGPDIQIGAFPSSFAGFELESFEASLESLPFLAPAA
jgi:hypothetical protein